jgi:Flp pilus assembly pilin Flp
MVSPPFPIREMGEGSFMMGMHTQMKQQLKRLWSDDQGQSTTEYILILAVVVMIAMKFKTTFGSKLNTVVDNLGTQLDSATSSTN